MKTRYHKIPVYEISIPEYQVKTKPDWNQIGKKLDDLLKKYYLERNIKIAVRALSSQQHKKCSQDDLIKIIKKIGHDRYNPKRKGDRYENIENKKIDIFCLDWKLTSRSKRMWQFIWSFYEFPKEKGKRPVKVDLFIVYDLNQLIRVKHQYKGRIDIKDDGFIFKNPDRKPEAILGIIKVI